MGLPLGGGPFGTSKDDEEKLLNVPDPALDLDELPGTLHSWHHQLDGWYGVVTDRYPVHGEELSLSSFIGVLPGSPVAETGHGLPF